eukprot:SAG11_NODE_15458_length_577_cov_1.456067_1_plen_157_part_00
MPRSDGDRSHDPALTVLGQSHGPREQSRVEAGASHSHQEQQPSAPGDMRNLVGLNAETLDEIRKSTRVESYSTNVLGTDTQCGTNTVPKTSTGTDFSTMASTRKIDSNLESSYGNTMESQKLPEKEKFQHKHRKNDTGDYQNTMHLQNSRKTILPL